MVPMDRRERTEVKEEERRGGGEKRRNREGRKRSRTHSPVECCEYESFPMMCGGGEECTKAKVTHIPPLTERSCNPEKCEHDGQR